MTTCQTITIDYDEEMKNTRKLLARVPLDGTHRGYKPHDKSMPLERLATQRVRRIPLANARGWEGLIPSRDGEGAVVKSCAGHPNSPVVRGWYERCSLLADQVG